MAARPRKPFVQLQGKRVTTLVGISPKLNKLILGSLITFETEVSRFPHVPAYHLRSQLDHRMIPSVNRSPACGEFLENRLDAFAGVIKPGQCSVHIILDPRNRDIVECLPLSAAARFRPGGSTPSDERWRWPARCHQQPDTGAPCRRPFPRKPACLHGDQQRLACRSVGSRVNGMIRGHR